MFFTYIICNRKRGVLYTGHTDDLGQRMEQHRLGVYGGFAAKHECHKLIWFETHITRDEAFKRERQIKEWQRAWKVDLIEALNPNWDDVMLSLTVDDIESERRMFRLPTSADN